MATGRRLENPTGALSVGRKRRHDRHLPQRMYLRCGTYYLACPDGRWISLGRDLAEAMAAYGRAISPKEFGDATERCSTIGDVIKRYRIEILPTKAVSTRREQARQLNHLFDVFGEMRPAEITPQHIYRYLDLRREHPTVARHEVALLGHVFAKAIRWGVTTTNPVRGVEKPRSRPRTRYVSDAEFLTVRSLAGCRLQVAMDLALLTGLRRGDLLALTRDSLTADGILVRMGKTGKALLIEYTPDLVAVLDRAKKIPPQLPGYYVLRTSKGQPYTASGFATNWQRLMRKAQKAGVERFSFHDLRAKSASDTPDVHEASARLGHSSVGLTQRVYIRAPRRVRPLK